MVTNTVASKQSKAGLLSTCSQASEGARKGHLDTPITHTNLSKTYIFFTHAQRTPLLAAGDHDHHTYWATRISTHLSHMDNSSHCEKFSNVSDLYLFMQHHNRADVRELCTCLPLGVAIALVIASCRKSAERSSCLLGCMRRGVTTALVGLSCAVMGNGTGCSPDKLLITAHGKNSQGCFSFLERTVQSCVTVS